MRNHPKLIGTMEFATYAYTMEVQTAYKRAVSELQGRLIAPYQREGVCWMLFRELQTVKGPKGGFLCDEMGLGKTVQVISTILGNPKQRTLIVVPKSIVNQWNEEIEHFAPNLNVYLYDGTKRTKDPQEFLKHDIIIAPYSLLITKKRSELTILHRIQWDRVVLDEGHEIRNPASKITKNALQLESGIRWIISGTPVYNSMRDFVTLAQFIGISKQIVQGYTDKVRETYILRRTKEDVAKHNQRLTLPPCDFENVELEMSEDEKELYTEKYTEICQQVKTILRSSLEQGMKAMAILECLLRCRQLMIHPQLYYDGIAKKNGEDPEIWEGHSNKMNAMFDMIESHPSEKALIFSMFTGEMNYIKTEMENRGKTVFVLNGSITREQREQQLIHFKKFDGGCIFIIQIKAGGQGLNLQQATRVYITAPSWNPATELQAIARSHRTGQTRKVVVRKFIYTGTNELPSIEQSIVSLQQSKAEISSKVLNDVRLATQIPSKFKNTKLTIYELKKIFSI